jgi:hypothetical protein
MASSAITFSTGCSGATERQHDHWRRAASVVLRRVERVADHRRETHHPEVVGGHEAHLHLRRPVVLHQVQRHRRVLGDVGERLRALAEVVDLGHGERNVVAALGQRRLTQVHQAVAVLVRERSEEHAARR